MPLIRCALSQAAIDLLYRVARAGRPLEVQAIPSPWSPSPLDELLEREMVMEIERFGDWATIVITERGGVELAI